VAELDDLRMRLEKTERTAAGFRREALTALETVRQVCQTLELSESTRRKLLAALFDAQKEIEALRAEHAKVKDVERAAKQAMEAAEQIRREGVEALEEARTLSKKK
jgi:hypothetical protein